MAGDLSVSFERLPAICLEFIFDKRPCVLKLTPSSEQLFFCLAALDGRLISIEIVGNQGVPDGVFILADGFVVVAFEFVHDAVFVVDGSFINTKYFKGFV